MRSNDAVTTLSGTRNNSNHFRRILSDVTVVCSFAAISVSMLMTVGDIFLRIAATAFEQINGVRPNSGLYGLVDLTQLAIMSAVPLAIAVAFFNNKHIRIDLLLDSMPRKLRQASTIFSALIGMALIGVSLWTAWREMLGQLDFTTTSATLGIPYTWYWLPLLLGFALCLMACAMNLFSASISAKQE